MNAPSHTVLCVDDEQNILHALKRLLRKENYRILTATSGDAAFELLRQHEVHLVVSDQRMPDMSGTDFLSRVKDEYPDILRIILTGYTDVDSITESINKGHIFKFFLKPWNDNNLKLEFRQALEQYDLIQVNKRLDETLVQRNKQLKEINERLEAMVEERTMEIALKNQALEFSHAILENMPIPIIGVDNDTMVVLTNKMAQSIFDGNGINVGTPMDDHFPEAIIQAVRDVVMNHGNRLIHGADINADKYNVQVSALSGRFKGKGVIISLFLTN